VEVACRVTNLLLLGGLVVLVVIAALALRQTFPAAVAQVTRIDDFDSVIDRNAERMIEEGRQIFGYDTCGSEDFWGGKLRLHEAIVGEKLGGARPGVTAEQKRDLKEFLNSM
jgi:hypothetical protein